VPRKVIRSLDEFAAQFIVFGKNSRGAQRLAVAQSTDRVERALSNAASRLAGGDRVLSGVGKNGAKLSVRTLPSFGDENYMRVVFRKEGPWQLRDSSVSGGNTRPRFSSPRNDKNPRPLVPARKFMPSLRTRDGKFYSNFNTGSGPYVNVALGTGQRIPAWRNAVQSVQPVVIDLHQLAFDRAMYDTFT
jgi:hypothetical protein